MKHFIRMISLFLALLFPLLSVSCAKPGEGTETAAKTDAPAAGTTAPAETEPPILYEWQKNVPGVYPGEAEGVDFVMNVESGKDIQILQLTDTQLCNPANAKNSTRKEQLGGAYYSDGIVDFEEKTGKYIRQILKHTTPDLIVLTGDIVYGETDDSGEDLRTIIDFMESFEIPWAPVFGNHDNESQKGVLWQCEQFVNAPHCIFKRGNVTGNSNYNIVLRQDGEIKYTVYCLDTNECRVINNPGEGLQKNNPDYKLIKQQNGIFDDQIEWFVSTNKAIQALAGKDVVPNMVFQHIEMYQFYQAMQEKYDPDAKKKVITLKQDGDFGYFTDGWNWGEGVDKSGKFFSACKENGTMGIFFGHEHDNDASVVYQGIRLTFGSKTGTHTFYVQKLLGGTQIFLNKDTGEMTVQHIKNQQLTKLEQEG